jgi:threonine aldolase
MNFASDNVTGVAPAIMAAIAAANRGAVASYGADELTRRLEQRFAEIFEHDVAVFPVATGSAANALAVATLTPPWGAVYCHHDAHIAVDEANAPEFYSGGAKLQTLDGSHGKLDPAILDALLPGNLGDVHHAQPSAISISQASEAGTVYRPDEIAALAGIAHRHGLGVHMDGARLANALDSLGASPADVTWRAGIDVLSFGATKNGALAAEAIVFFDRSKARDLPFRRKRGGHLISKMRFVSAQLEAYLADELWLHNAAHANAAAARLAVGLAGLPGIALRHPVEANELFVEMPESVITGLLDRGFNFYRWGSGCVRLVTAFDTSPESVGLLLAAARDLAV